jgi:hypothetical protein
MVRDTATITVTQVQKTQSMHHVYNPIGMMNTAINFERVLILLVQLVDTTTESKDA